MNRKRKNRMSKKLSAPPPEEGQFEQAAVHFLNSNGHSLVEAATELGIDPAELRVWKKKHSPPAKAPKSLSGMARLRAENEALRNQVLNLQVQWDILKTTLGVLSTTVCSRDTV